MKHRWTYTLLLILAVCVVKLWLMPLSSSFWVDEMATAFVVRFGPAHESLGDVAPQAWRSLYYYLPLWASALPGPIEVIYRLPSTLAMAGTLILTALLGNRLAGRGAGWLVVFLCLALPRLDYHAADAHPYALGMCLASAALLFLVRWLDAAHGLDAAAFIVCASLLWRVHLLFWPFYLLAGLYTAVRMLCRETPAKVGQVALTWCVLLLSVLPLLQETLSLASEAPLHAFAPPPTLFALFQGAELPFLIVVGAAACLAALVGRWPSRSSPPVNAVVLAAGWLLIQPLAIYVYSVASGNSIFVDRYLSLNLPGVALTATLAIALWIPRNHWQPAAALIGILALAVSPRWSATVGTHGDEHWRQAAQAVNEAVRGSPVPVLCPSPFGEATPPVWRSDYPLPGFLYAHLFVYPIQAAIRPLPFDNLIDSADDVAQNAISGAREFILYGTEHGVDSWSSRPAFRTFRAKQLGSFGKVKAIRYTAADAPDQ